MIERVERPDLDEYRVGVAECCGSRAGERFCESFGCRSITELLAYALQLEQDAAKARVLVDTIEQHCPCGARPESPQTHPHNDWCPVAALKTLLAAGS